jgi:3-deoxy-manno-octulosonate cytidylyltransferase (CMP-KDO synthetase)
MRTAIVVPARYASTRYPGKPLANLTGPGGITKPLIQWSWDAARQVPGIDRVIVATDDARIAAVVEAFGGTVAMTPESASNGSERCAAVAGLEDVDLIVNLQGDAPLTPPGYITALIDTMRADDSVAVATPVLKATAAIHRRLLADQHAGRVGGTTAVQARSGDALYFSKSVIPHVPVERIGTAGAEVLLHVGVYAYRPSSLQAYAAMPPGRLELLEGLEQLRFLEHGIPVRLVEVAAPDHDLWELNNPEDRGPIETALVTRAAAA